MKPAAKLRSIILNIALSERSGRLRRWSRDVLRRLLRRPHTVSAFLQLDDPYSYLLAHYLPELADTFDIELRYYLTQSCGEEAFRPQPQLLDLYAHEDCARVAAELGIPFLDKGVAPPVEHRKALIDSLAAVAESPDFDAELVDAALRENLLQKPFNSQVLLNRVRELLDQGGAIPLRRAQ